MNESDVEIISLKDSVVKKVVSVDSKIKVVVGSVVVLTETACSEVEESKLSIVELIILIELEVEIVVNFVALDSK